MRFVLGKLGLFKAVIAVGFVAALCLSLPVFALPKDVNLQKISKIPSFHEELTEESFLQNSELHEEEPLGDRFLAYQVRLPRGWQRTTSAEQYKGKQLEEAGLSQRILGQVARYVGPGRIDSISKFEIEALNLDHEVTARNWFMNEILARGFSLEGMQVESDKRVEALYVLVEADTAYVVRSVAEINGPRMIVASYYVPDNHWEEERAYQQRAIESFRFVSPEKSRIEMTRSYSFLDLLSFEYPSSWKLVAPNIFDIQGMEAKLVYSPNERILGGEMYISIISVEFEDMFYEEVAYLKERLNDMGLNLGELMEQPDNYVFNDHIYYGYVEVYRAYDPQGMKQEHEYWLAIMEEDRYLYLVTMLTPSRNNEFYGWARNEEAFKTVIESFAL